MTLKKIKSLARGLLNAPGRILGIGWKAITKTRNAIKASPKATYRAFVAACISLGTAIHKQDPQGEFHLPKAVRPFFFPTLWVVILSASPFLYFWLDASIKKGHSLLVIVENGAKIAPGFLAASIAAALLLSLPAYLISGSLTMLGPLFRRLVEGSSLEAKQRIIDQQKETIEERDNTIGERDNTISELRQRLTDHGIDPDATDG